MRLLDLSLPTPAENLACDEALLDWTEESLGDEVLRFWESTEYFVVVGYGNRIETEVHTTFCRENNIPILRRCSGGGTVLQGPGVLNYSLLLSTDSAGPCHSIGAANTCIMERHRDILASLLNAPVQVQGHTDLTIRGLKFSGNAQRRRKQFLLFHGSLLLNFDLNLIERALSMPSKQPAYRRHRPHSEFLTNLNLSSESIKTALRDSWHALELLDVLPHERISSLAARYSSDEWTHRSLAPQHPK